MSKSIDRLVDIMQTLRGPHGCPWDREQTHRTILSCLLDETYEFFTTVEENDYPGMKEELGDILLQIVFHAQLAHEEGKFSIDDVADEICEKLIRRHPHVFGNTIVDSSAQVVKNWDAIKKQEKGKENRKSILDGIPARLPALLRAQKVQRRVGKVGFDWHDIEPVLDKVEEEFREFRQALAEKDAAHATEELGDIIFSLVNLARHRNICAEEALTTTINKFIKRFTYVEQRFRALNRPMIEATLEEMDLYWQESKQNPSDPQP
ncbi:MAG: nucleoside triphosphate pyrophosphohydrolase [Chitinivibrionales bacterium]|nr:nucleoside triphosphate pyrophosphohydrolase [Chitinivibrionales bacterium]